MSFCFDEACDYIVYELSKEHPKDPKWEDEEKHTSSDNNKSTIEWMMRHNKPL